MVQLKYSEKRVIEDAFGMSSGYVLDFSDRTMAEFFYDELRLDIYADIYNFNGTSKAKRLRAFIEIESVHTVTTVLRALWKHKEQNYGFELTPDVAAQRNRLFELLTNLESAEPLPNADAVERFTKDETLDELVAAIHRDIAVNKPAAALDRLHTYCMKKFAHLLDARGIDWDRSDPLQSRVGKYIKALEGERELRELTRRAAKSSISVLDAFNDIRNNKSFAHDNELVDEAEARFVFDTISAFLRFLKSVDTLRFGS